MNDLDLALVLKPATADAAIWFMAGTAHSRLAQSKQAMAAFTKAIELGRSDVKVWSARANEWALLDEWSKAAADFARALQHQPEDTNLWYLEATAHLGAGDEASYRKVRAAIFKRFGKTTYAGAASHVLYVSVAVPAAAEESPVLLRLGKLGATAFPGNERLLGAALYRAGQYQDGRAVRACRQFFPAAWIGCSSPCAPPPGRLELATQCLQNAAQWIDRADREQAAAGPTCGLLARADGGAAPASRG